MHRARLLVPFVSALALAACSTDKPELVAPVSASRAVQAGSSKISGRYIVLATTAGFGADFTKQVNALGGKVDHLHGSAGIAAVSGMTDAAAAQMARVSGVSEVQPDMVISLDQPVASITADASAAGDPSTTSPTHALKYSWQWNMRLIEADVAWAAGKLGNPGVRVAIIDTGIDYDALDLNGLVDLASSASFVPSDDSISASVFPNRNKISDYNGHGTNVSTQVSSNAVALAGVTSQTTLIGVKVLGADGSGALSGVLEGVLWSADHGADVANMSLGGNFPRAGNGRYIRLISRVFDYASRKGMLIVVAAGNDAANLDIIPHTYVGYCDAPHVVCVSSVGPPTATDFATSGADTPAFYTNFGRKSIDVAGPGGNAKLVGGVPQTSAWPWGVDIASWVWSFCSKTRLVLDANGTPVALAGCQAGNRLVGEIGTSQATPHVTGLAALLVAQDGHLKPAQIKREIERSADDLGPSGRDDYYGSGRIDVARALGLEH